MKLWIARDKDSSLYLYDQRPVLNNTLMNGVWESTNIDIWYDYDIDNALFPEVTFENSPQQVEIKLIKEE